MVVVMEAWDIVVSFLDHRIKGNGSVMAWGWGQDVDAQEQTGAERDGGIAQQPGSRPLEQALDPQFATESAESLFWQHVQPYVGPTLLSFLVLGFLIFLLFQRRLKEARLAVFATVLLGVALPIWLSVKFTLDSLNVDRPIGQVPPSLPPSESTPVTPSQSPAASGATVEEDSLSSSVAAIGLRNLDVDVEFEPPAAWLTTPEQNAVDGPEEERSEPDATALDELEDGDGLEDGVEGDVAALNALEDEVEGDAVTTDDALTPTGATGAIMTAGDSASEAIASTRRPPIDLGASPRPNPQLTPTNAGASSTSASPSPSITATANMATGGGAPIPPRLRGVNFDAPIAFRAFLRQGLRGHDVIVLQKLLQELGFYDAEPDGYFGAQTAIAVQAFQQQHNLLDDGVVGFSTCEILNAQVRNVKLACRE